MAIIIRHPHWRAMRSHVVDQLPLEACGILAGENGISSLVIPTRNLRESATQYQIHPQDQIRAFYHIENNGWDILAVFHSHPVGPRFPSPADVAEAAYPDIPHLIWAPSPDGWDCRAFSINYGKIVPIEISLTN